MMKFLILSCVLVLTGCWQSNSRETLDDTVDLQREVTPHFDEIETLLSKVELEAGLQNLSVATSYFNELLELVADHEVTVQQQMRINTMHELLADTMVVSSQVYELVEEPLFTGSDAAAKVMNMIGHVDGYKLIYHRIPSFVGSTGIGFHVLLVPDDSDPNGEINPREKFFVTNNGEISVLE